MDLLFYGRLRTIMFPNWAKIILFLLVFMISGLVLVIIIDGLHSGTELIPLNIVIEQVVAHMRTPFFTTLLVSITRLGSPFALSSLAVVVSSILVSRGRYHDASLFIVALLVSVVSLTILKNTFQITRPVSDLVEASGWSFPSGHATVATAFFFLLAHAFFNRMKTLSGKVVLISGSILSVALISFSRLYLGAHWILDILAGIALGLLSVSFVVLLFSIFAGDKYLLKGKVTR